MSEQQKPPLPDLAEAGAFYWKSGENKEFTLGWCEQCTDWQHPAREACPKCLTKIQAKAATGEANLVSYTINHQAWLANPAPPYIIAIIAPKEDSSIQLTSMLITPEQEPLHIGESLQVDFIHHEDVWLPIFKPAKKPSAIKTIFGPPNTLNIPSPIRKYENSVAFTGIGKSQIGRKLERSPSLLMIDACKNALSDAGLSVSQIDGVCAYPGTSGIAGFSDGGVRELSYAMNLKPTWHMGAQEVPGQTGSLTSAMLAIDAGLCRHVLCVTGFSTSILPAGNSNRIRGERRWSLPYGCVSPANWIALYANRYMDHYGVNETLLGNVAIAARKHASMNPDALYKKPLDMAAYLSSRKISTPFKLLDCDTPCNGAIAFVISHVDMAKDAPQKAVYVEACGTAFSEIQSWDQGTIEYQPNVFSSGRHLWSRTDFVPKDIDVAELYDGFTFNVICWLEGMGFCEPGGAKEFIGNGEHISLGGKLPINTHGGHLNAGRSNGYGHLYEAIVQLRREAGERQVKEASTAVAACGGGIPAGAMLLTRER